jgi:hypothetical protein
MWRQGVYEEKKLLDRILASISSLYADTGATEEAYGYMGFGARESLGTNI